MTHQDRQQVDFAWGKEVRVHEEGVVARGMAWMRRRQCGSRVGKAGGGLMEIGGAVQVNAALGEKFSY